MSATKTIVKVVHKNPLAFIINILAVMVSWYFNHSILWAIFAYMFGMIYMLYSLLTGRFADGGFMEIMNSYF
jgi:hypothetical protein